MVKTFMRKKSKRQSCRQKYKIDKKVREHKRKVRKEQKKKGKTKLKKDPGIPNLYPFKEQLLKQIEDKKQKDVKDEQKRKEQLQRDKKLKSLHNLKSDAEKRTRQFEQKQEWEEAMTDIQGLEIGEDGSRKAYYREFKRVVELSDVVLEVLDARDPLGCRCPQVEQAIIASGANKKLILVLNKIDLVPKSNVEAWLKYLRRDFPTVAFKASTQSQRQNLSRKKLPQGIIPDDVKESSACFGANVLMKLLGNYCRNADIRTSITVGIVGLPNVGKSSIINSLKRSRACSVGATPGVTKAMQEVQLDKHIKMLDSPGIVIAKSGDHSSAVLRNCIKVENLTDLTSPVEAILRRCNRVKVMEFYCIPEFADVHEFLTHVARRIGRLKKGGVPDVEAAARHVLHDWNSGRITFYTHPPEQSHGSERMPAEIVSEWSKAFDLDSIEVDEKQDLSGLDDKMETMCVSMESSQPAEMEQLDSSDGSSDEEMSSELTVQEGELIYDFAWFPMMNSMDPDSCCFASACRDHPVHLWDAYTGVMRATYTPYNHLDEVTSPNSLSFNVDGSQLYCGFSNCLRIFDITRPGRQVENRETFKKNSPLGLQGIVSCIAFNPQYPEVYALGTYSKSIGLYSETSFGPMSIFSGVGGGVTHVMFSGDGNYLFSGSRKDPEVVCWDLRNPGKILYYLNRMVDTNQRMYFDLDITNRYLMSGHQNGAVSIWDTQNLPGDRDNDDSLLQLEPVFSFLAHNDCVNSISHHPTLPILASGSGQRKFSLPCLCTMSDGSDSDESGTSEEDTHENSLKLWHFIPHSTNHLSFSSGSSDLF